LTVTGVSGFSPRVLEEAPEYTECAVYFNRGDVDVETGNQP